MKIIKIFSVMLACCLLPGCAYLQQTFKHAEYKAEFNEDHKKSIQKHLLTSETFLIYGKLIDNNNLSQTYPLAVAAMANTGDGSELVDINQPVRANSFYALHLPAGDYQILTLADVDGDGFYKNSEILALRPLHLDIQTYPDHVAGSLDIELGRPGVLSFASAIKIEVQTPTASRQQDSIFYPKGSIRTLDDQIFSSTNAMIGLYSPADFMEQTPTMFYALEEYQIYKVPVVFVHGIGGSVTDFSPIVNRLDRQRYQPWFYYYPSGADLDKLAQLFYRIFLSGKVVNLDERTPLIVVAHSMGGLVVRQAINFYKGAPNENRIKLFISIATPFGGHPDAAMGIEMAPMVLPSWYNLNPEGTFIHNLYKKPIPESIEHYLLYAYANPSSLKLGENSDGVVPLSSQLYPPAQQQATRQYGYNDSHTGILSDKDMITTMLQLIAKYKTYFPESHMKYLVKGGYDIQLPDSYSEHEKYAIHYLGKFLNALAKGLIQPTEKYEARFVAVLNGETKPSLFTESAWLKFRADFPGLAAENP
jgi:pimeloyl-ACP methyl ester carboxylesterase